MTSPVDTAADFLVARHTRKVLDLEPAAAIPTEVPWLDAYEISCRIDRYLGHSHSVADWVELRDLEQPVPIADIVAETRTAMAPGPVRGGMR